MKYTLIVFIFLTIDRILAQRPCVPRYYYSPDYPWPKSFNCVCNSTYCDDIPSLGTLAHNQAAIYTSSQRGKRFVKSVVNFQLSGTPSTITIQADPSIKNQTIYGFGGAMTDFSGYQISLLSQGAQENLLKAYFGQGPESIGYSIARVPIAACDYSLKTYSYDDTDQDFNLTNFALDQEDFDYKIPYLHQIQALRTGASLRFFASPWSPPAWMKETNKMRGGGFIRGDMNGPYYQAFANYFVRFFEEYHKQGIDFWGVTMENEPMEGMKETYGNYALGLNSTMERDFAKGTWGPALKNNPLTQNLKLMVMDENRFAIEGYANDIFGDPEASKYADGIAIHWYGDRNTTAQTITAMHEKFPDKFFVYTEACHLHPPRRGSWQEGDDFMHYITDVLNNWVSAWTQWNMCLNPTNGQSTPILVYNETDEFEKQPIYYALGHLSKFIVPDSVIIRLNIQGLSPTSNSMDQPPFPLPYVEGVAALTPTGQTVQCSEKDWNVDNFFSIIFYFYSRRRL